MGRIGTFELLVILAVILLVFGPKKLPELARGMGEAIKEFKKGQKEFDNTINEPVITETKENDKVVETKTVTVVEEENKNNK